jgi:hypothetical protein
MFRAYTLLLLFNCCTILSFAQRTGKSQTIRGTIKEASIGVPIPGASISIETDPSLQTITDASGQFSLLNVPLGRHKILITAKGYKPIQLSNIEVDAGKEQILTLSMEEEIQELKTITITNRRDKSAPVNALSLVSARSFSAEETGRYAAGINDLSRIATGFAGVSNNSSDGNAIIIRGNAPNGLLWRLEGVDIPNPNHFARVGTAGGAISMLSAQLLDKSDLVMGAFPAEYGNALSGVFDIHLRKGNNQKREHTLAISTMGVDFATEGYFSKKYKGSYLLNYRYNYLELIRKMGIALTEAETHFQDLSFHVHLPAGKIGTFSIFGFGGSGQQEQIASRDSLEWTTQPSKRNGWLDAVKAGATGITHELLIGKKIRLRNVLSINAFSYRDDNNRLNRFNAPLTIERTNRFDEWNSVLSSTLHYKINSRHLLKSGIYTTEKNFYLRQRELSGTTLQNRTLNEGETHLLNAFIQWKWDITPALRFQAGLHRQQLALNNTSSTDPRVGLRWKTGNKTQLSAAYGHHAQIQPMGNYFARGKIGNDTILPNRSLQFSKAHHYVLGLEHQVNKNLKFRSEVYYQHLYDVPVSASTRTNFSLINMDDDFTIQALANNGKGKNYGLELTLERSWNDNIYFITTLSLYQSRYLPSDNIWRNTRYNSNNSFTLLTGKEWQFRKTKKPQSFALDIRMMHTGGVRVTPIDIGRSIQQKRTVYDNTRLYEQKLRSFFRLDVQLKWKVQYASMTGALILGVQNATGQDNPVSHSFNATTNSITYRFLFGFLPVFGYKVDL